MGELCWKCKEEADRSCGRNYKGEFQPWVHCHHEPKEKPKCWCEKYEEFICKVFLIKTGEFVVSDTNFCPDCGKKVNP